MTIAVEAYGWRCVGWLVVGEVVRGFGDGTAVGSEEARRVGDMTQRRWLVRIWLDIVVCCRGRRAVELDVVEVVATKGCVEGLVVVYRIKGACRGGWAAQDHARIDRGIVADIEV